MRELNQRLPIQELQGAVEQWMASSAVEAPPVERIVAGTPNKRPAGTNQRTEAGQMPTVDLGGFDALQLISLPGPWTHGHYEVTRLGANINFSIPDASNRTS